MDTYRKSLGHWIRHSKRLKAMGVHTAADFVQLPDGWVKKTHGHCRVTPLKELLGETTLALEQQVNTKKAIATTRTFENELSNLLETLKNV